MSLSLDSTKKILLAVVVLFFVISLWQDPSGSADAFTEFVGSVGSFFSAVIDKGAAFVRSLLE